MKTLDRIICIGLDVSIWSGRKKLAIEDTGVNDPSELPPAEIASLGNKKVVNPEDLRIFHTLKKRAERHLDDTGLRFLGGWGMPDEKFDEAAIILDELKAEFQKEADAFESRFDTAVQSWAEQHPAWAHIILDAQESREEVRSKFRFSWIPYRVTGVGDSEPIQDIERTMDQGEQEVDPEPLMEEVRNLGNRLFTEVADSARDAWEKTFQGRDNVTRRALSPIKKMLKKLKGLAFVDPKVVPICECITSVLNALPKMGKIEGRDLMALHGLLFILSDSEKMAAHGQAILDGSDPNELVWVEVPSLEKQVLVYGVDEAVQEEFDQEVSIDTVPLISSSEMPPHVKPEQVQPAEWFF